MTETPNDARLDRLAEVLCDISEGEGQWQRAMTEPRENEQHATAIDEFIEAWRGEARRTLTAVHRAGYVVTIDDELRDAHQVIAVLLRRLGGEVTVTDREIVEVERTPTIQSFRSDDRDGVVLRAL